MILAGGNAGRHFDVDSRDHTHTPGCHVCVVKCVVSPVSWRPQFEFGARWSRDGEQSGTNSGCAPARCLMEGHSRFIAFAMLSVQISCLQAIDRNNTAQAGSMWFEHGIKTR